MNGLQIFGLILPFLVTLGAMIGIHFTPTNSKKQKSVKRFPSISKHFTLRPSHH